MTKLDSATFPDIASYYARQPPTLRSGGTSAQGKQLFLHGAGGVPACAACHGLEGRGNGMVPRLAGQHHDYLLSQLQRLQLGLRFSDTMHPTLKAMSDAQASAIAVYLAKN